jgi:flagellar hook assembly protein FlgD
LIGKKIVGIVNQYQNSGSYNFSWNGKTDIGDSVAAGIYFLQLNLDGKIQSKKIILLR